MIARALVVVAGCALVVAARALVVVAAALAVGGCKRLPRRCFENAACASNEHCVFSPGLCGTGKRAGTCRVRPRRFDPSFEPVCGCDRHIHPSEAAASAAGVDLAVNGGCGVLRDFIACGAHYCDPRLSYCEIVLSDVADPPTDYTCKPLPPACRPDGKSARSCDCFPAATRCRSFCGPLDSGGGVAGFHLTCRL